MKAAATFFSFLFFMSVANTDSSKKDSSTVSNAPVTAPTRTNNKVAAKREHQKDAPVASETAIPVKPKAAPPSKESSDMEPSDAAPSSNVEVVNIPDIGKREAGVVDQVIYAVERIDKAPSIGSEFSMTQADGTFAVVRVICINTDKKTHHITTSIMKLLDAQGREYDASDKGGSALLMTGDSTADLGMSEVQPDTPKRFSLVYDVPPTASGFKIKIPSGTFSLDKDLVIKAP